MNINNLNRQMFSRDIENEFSLIENGKSIRSILNVSNLDISNYSAIVGISLNGSLNKINDEISKTEIKNLRYHKISKYVDYIKLNIVYLDLSKINNDLYLTDFNNAGKTYNFVKNFFILYFYSLSNDLPKLRETILYILSKITEKSLENCSSNNLLNKFKSIMNEFFKMFNNEKQFINDYNLWEMLFEDIFYNIFLNYDLTKKMNDVDKFNVNEVLNFQKSQIIKSVIESFVKKSISIHCYYTNNNINLSSLYRKNSKKLNDDINTLREKHDFFSSSILSNFLDIFNEY